MTDKPQAEMNGKDYYEFCSHVDMSGAEEDVPLDTFMKDLFDATAKEIEEIKQRLKEQKTKNREVQTTDLKGEK